MRAWAVVASTTVILEQLGSADLEKVSQSLAIMADDLARRTSGVEIDGIRDRTQALPA